MSDMLCFFSNYLHVVVRQFCAAVEIKAETDTFCDQHETWRVGSLGFPPVCWSRILNTFCDLHETPRYGSSGFPICLPRFGMRAHSRCLDLVPQGTLESSSESNLAKETGVCERTQVDGQFRKVQARVLVLLCFDSAIWLTWYPSCLLVTVWLERSIAFFSEFLISQSESNLVKNLESVNARKWTIEFEKFKLGCLDFCCVNVKG